MTEHGTLHSDKQINPLISKCSSGDSAEIEEDLSLHDFFRQVQTGTWQQPVEQIREKFRRELRAGKTFKEAKKAVAHLKMRLPGVLPSGRFTYRNKESIVEHSGVLGADLDELNPESLAKIRERLKTSPYIRAVFLSPTGSGLKAFFLIPADKSTHEDSFQFIRDHVKALTGICIDESCKDCCRLVFASYDPEIWINPSSPEVIPLCYKGIKDKEMKDKGIEDKEIETNSIPLSLCNREERSKFETSLLVQTIKAHAEKEKKLKEDNPGLARLYVVLVGRRYKPEEGKQNNFISTQLPLLYRATSADVALRLTQHFYELNQSLFKDSLEEHMKQATAHLCAVRRTYEEGLPSEIFQAYQVLPTERERDLFRIIRDFALSDHPEPVGLVRIPFTHFGFRVGLAGPHVQRIVEQKFWMAYGFLERVTKGKQWKVDPTNDL